MNGHLSYMRSYIIQLIRAVQRDESEIHYDSDFSLWLRKSYDRPVKKAQLKATQCKTALRSTTVQFISGNHKFFHTVASLRWLTFSRQKARDQNSELKLKRN